MRAKPGTCTRSRQSAFISLLIIQEERESPGRRLILAPSERANHGNIHNRLDPQTGRIQKKTGGMAERDLGELSRPTENATGHLQ